MESFFSSHWILTFLVLWPLIGAVAVFLVSVEQAKRVALVVGAVEFLVSIPLFWAYDPGGPAMQMEAGNSNLQNPNPLLPQHKRSF